ncbi:MAG: hypothetical protein RJQ04_13795 [Longimicrobiales bacterium]
MIAVRRERGAAAVIVAGISLATYTALGHHPVPVLSYGVAPILGYYGGVAPAATHPDPTTA